MRYTEFKIHLHEGKLQPGDLHKYGPDSPRMVAFVDKLTNSSPFELNAGGTVVLARPDEHDGHNQKVIDKLKLSPFNGEEGYRIISNAGANGVQDVPHLHIHILGGKPLGRMLGKD